MGDKLGPMLWQFAPTKKFDAADFGKFLELLPAKLDGRKLRHVVEVRHDSFCVAASSSPWCANSHTPVVFAEHEKYPAIADPVGDFVYARLQKGEDSIPTAYPPKALDAWANARRSLGQGRRARRPAPRRPDKKAKAAPRDVFVYFIHEGKVRAPAAAMALIERLDK